MSIKTGEKETSVKIEGNNTFIRNEGKDYGGAIFNSGSSFLLKGTQVFQENSSGAHGGAVANLDGTFSIEGGATFLKNNSYSGGALFNWSSQTQFLKATHFEDNKAELGGAISNYKDATIVLSGTSNDFVKNKADTYGGAIYNNAELTITGNTTFEANEAVSGGCIV